MNTTDNEHNKFTDYIYTYTGARVDEIGGSGVPTVTDIAVHCGRIPRFIGATAVWWPVLLHLFVVQRLVSEAGGNAAAQLEALFHDAHESVTGDIPSPFKPKALSKLQHEMDQRMRTHYGIPKPSSEVAALVKEADTVALLAEAVLVGPPYPPEDNWIAERGGAAEDAKEIVRQVLEMYPGYADTLEVTGSAVQDYIMLFESLLEVLA